MARKNFHEDVVVPGMKSVQVLSGQRGVVRIVQDTYSGTYSIGLETRVDTSFKMISKELYEALEKELIHGQELDPFQEFHEQVKRMIEQEDSKKKTTYTVESTTELERFKEGDELHVNDKFGGINQTFVVKGGRLIEKGEKG